MCRFSLFIATCLVGIVSPVVAQQGQIGATDTQPPLGIQVQAGRRASFVCPALVSAQITDTDVWGTGVYHSDSPICVAAIHAGVLKTGQAGLVTIRITAGADSFDGSSSNGITSKSYGSYGMGYVFDASAPGQIDWWTTGMGIPPKFTAAVPVSCPGGGAAAQAIYGTDVYTEDSSICTAAVHAGLITRPAGGTFFVSTAPAQDSYPASERHGVKSAYWSGPNPGFRLSNSSTPLIATATGVTVPGTSSSVIGTVAPTPVSPTAISAKTPIAAVGTVAPVSSTSAAPPAPANTGLPRLADRVPSDQLAMAEECGSVKNVNVVAVGDNRTRATWAPMSSTCIRLFVKMKIEADVAAYWVMSWPVGDPTGCPDSLISLKDGYHEQMPWRSPSHPNCVVRIITADLSNPVYDDGGAIFNQAGSYVYRVLPEYYVYRPCSDDAEKAEYSYPPWPCYVPEGTVSYAYGETNFTLPVWDKIALSNKISPMHRTGTPPAAPLNVSGREKKARNRDGDIDYSAHLEWTGSDGAASYRVTRVRNTGDPEAEIVWGPYLWFATCADRGCSPDNPDFDYVYWGGPAPSYCRSGEVCVDDDTDVSLSGFYSYRIWAIAADGAVSAPSSVVNVAIN